MTGTLLHALDSLGPFGPAPHLAVAVSGGADSLSLALLADIWARERGGHITALTVDHGLRVEARAEAEYVADIMQQHRIAHVILTPAHEQSSNNLQERARQWRYDALAGWCYDHDVLHCLLAHHAGDQLETLALMQERGVTADGTSGMAAVRNYHGVRFLRPLLTTEKSALAAFLTENHIQWVEDPSNHSDMFARVRMRQTLQENPAYKEALQQQLHTGASARHARDMRLAQEAARIVRFHPLGFAELEMTAWQALEPLLAKQMLADILTTISGHAQRPRAHETERLYDALQQGQLRATLHHCDITLKNGMLRIARELARCEAPVWLEGTGQLFWDQRFSVHYQVPPQEKLLLRPLGNDSRVFGLPQATPSVWHLDALCFIPYMEKTDVFLPDGAYVQIGFAPAKPLASAPFWWLN